MKIHTEASIGTFRGLTPVILILLALSLLIGCPSARAQSGAGSIQGTITDSTGAVIPSAFVHVVNVATGVATDTQSNTVGFYQAPELFTGTYSVTVTAPGMNTYVTSIELLVAQTALINPVLHPGNVTQQITVSGDAVQLTTNDSGAIESTLENTRIDQIPMDGRVLLTLMAITEPGMADGGQKINGQPVEALNYVVDGVTSKSDKSGALDSTATQLIDPDSVQEVRIEASNSGAQYASPSTAIVSTKSGTNVLHGSFFETARNNSFGLARTRQDPVNFSAPHLVRNEFGASAGGPIILPHFYHGKGRTFWFFAFERYSLAQSLSTLNTVPTTAMRQGDFSGLITSANQLQVLYDPATTTSNSACPVPGSTSTVNNPYCRTAFTNNTIPINRISLLAQNYYKMLPNPTSANDPLVDGNLTAPTPTFQTIPQETFRIDQVFNENNRAYLRYTHNYSNQALNLSSGTGPMSLAVQSGSIDIPAGAAFGYKNTPSSSFLTALGYTHVFSPTFYSETILSQQWFSAYNLPGAESNLDYESMLGLPNNYGEAGFPEIGNTSLIYNSGTSQTGQSTDSQVASSVDQNFTKTWGKHQMQFGGRIRHDRAGTWPNGVADTTTFGTQPECMYNPSSGANYTCYSNTGNDDASLFIGSAQLYTIDHEPPYVHYHFWDVDSYFQDNYHWGKNFTVNVGLRYEAHPGLWEKDGLANSFDFKNDAMVLGATPASLIAKGYTTQAIITNDEYVGVKFETPAEAGMPNSLARNYNLNFLPRVGFAYLPFSGKWGTVIRGAYGRYDYSAPLQDSTNHLGTNNPFEAQYSTSYATASQAIDGLPNEQERYNSPVVFGVAGENTSNVVNTTSTTAILPSITIFSSDPNWAPTTETQTNFTIEQPFKGHSALRATYVWTHGTNLDVILNYNNHPTTYQWEMATGTTPPTGGASVIGTSLQNTYATTATGPYNQTTWSGNSWHTRAGWSNYNALQLNYQRLFNHGYAYQVSYVFAKSMRMGGNTADGRNTVDPVANYPGVLGTVGTMTSPYGTYYPGIAPPARPNGTPVWGDFHALNTWEQYQSDSDQPTMDVRFNFVVDLPLGRGKKFFGNSNRFVNELIGGFQLAGTDNIVSDLIQPTSQTLWGPTAPLKIYKHKAKVTDCTSGICYREYLWFNGYEPPSSTTGLSNSTCTSDCISGMPSDYQPVQTPVDNTPGTTYYGTNDVVVTLANGKQTTLAYDAGPTASNYLAKTWIHGPINWPFNASLFKVFPITERVNLRVNMDAFNVFNMPGENDPGTGGLEKFLTSYNSPRQIQITARLTF